MMFFSWGAEFSVKRCQFFFYQAATYSSCTVVSTFDKADSIIVTRVILRWEQSWWYLPTWVLEDVGLEDVWREVTLPSSFVVNTSCKFLGTSRRSLEVRWGSFRIWWTVLLILDNKNTSGIGITARKYSFFQNYCWWLKSCTTWDVWNPINNGINYL